MEMYASIGLIYTLKKDGRYVNSQWYANICTVLEIGDRDIDYINKMKDNLCSKDELHEIGK